MRLTVSENTRSRNNLICIRTIRQAGFAITREMGQLFAGTAASQPRAWRTSHTYLSQLEGRSQCARPTLVWIPIYNLLFCTLMKVKAKKKVERSLHLYPSTRLSYTSSYDRKPGDGDGAGREEAREQAPYSPHVIPFLS